MEVDKAEVAVVGAGVIGCAIAYFLSKEGVKVVVVEQDSIGSHASGFAYGGLNPLLTQAVLGIPRSLAWQSFEIHKVLYQELKETGPDYYFHQLWRMTLAFTEKEADELKSWVDLQQEQGSEIDWLDRGAVHTLESRVSSEVIGAAYYEAAAIDCYRYVLALTTAAEKYGAEIVHGKVTGLKRKGGKITAIELSSSRSVACERVILALGPWAGLASSWLNFPVPVRPEKGQNLRLRVPGPPFQYGLSWDGYHMMTKHDGLIWSGTTHDDVGFDDQPTIAGRDSIISGLLTMVPSLKEADLVLQTACLRPLSADGLPIIGEVPGWNGVYLATGHYGDGIFLSTITARIMIDLIVKGHTSTPIDLFAPVRFVR